MSTENTVGKGSVVRFNGGFYRVTALFAGVGAVNLGNVFGGHIAHKKVPLANVEEAHDEWMSSWRNSESYACM